MGSCCQRSTFSPTRLCDFWPVALPLSNLQLCSFPLQLHKEYTSKKGRSPLENGCRQGCPNQEGLFLNTLNLHNATFPVEIFEKLLKQRDTGGHLQFMCLEERLAFVSRTMLRVYDAACVIRSRISPENDLWTVELTSYQHSNTFSMTMSAV